MANDVTAEVVLAYYDSWKNGMASFDEARLRSLLAPDLDFEGPIAGKRRGAEPFLQGLARFVETLKGLRTLQQIHAGNEASVLYDCDLPAGTLRFAEFFHVEGEKIRAINLLYDPTKYRALGGG